jgi:single-stranded-DNA-specific exonuclease
VIGIVAARLVDKYYRPAIVISLADTTKFGKGSGRSIRGFNIYHGLKAVSEHLSEFGGHEFAAGFSIDPNKLATFRAALNRYAEDALEPTHLIRSIDIDVEVPFSNLTVRLAKEITLLAPFGSGNPEPVFLTRNLRVKKEGKSGSKFTSEFWVTDGEQVIGVSAKNELAEKIRECEAFDLAYTLELDDWQGQASVSLVAKDIKPIAPAFCIS